MTAHEIQGALQHYRARLEQVLTTDELATHDGYQQRLQAALDRGNTTPVPLSAAEQAVADKIASDTQAAALNRQFMALIGVEKLPQ